MYHLQKQLPENTPTSVCVHHCLMAYYQDTAAHVFFFLPFRETTRWCLFQLHSTQALQSKVSQSEICWACTMSAVPENHLHNMKT